MVRLLWIDSDAVGSRKLKLPLEGETWHEIKEETSLSMNDVQTLGHVSLSKNFSYLKINGLDL
jgi:hypothetical protein